MEIQRCSLLGVGDARRSSSLTGPFVPANLPGVYFLAVGAPFGVAEGPEPFKCK